MLNVRHLVYPTPCDPNIHPQSDGLLTLLEGTNDLNRFFFYTGLKPQHIDNRTSDPFNHTRNTGGYNNGGVIIYPDHVITANSKGGIVPLAPLPQTQNIGNELTNNPVPVLNALVDYRINPKINELVDPPLPPQINPMAVPYPKPDPDASFIKMLNPNEYKQYYPHFQK